VSTEWGEARVKLGYLGDGLARVEPEYEDCRRIADENELSLREVYRAVRTAAAAEGIGGAGPSC
jgi:uncharacterized protein (DUF111 family)